MIDYNQFMTVMHENIAEGQRRGQAAFNTLFQFDPDRANEIRGTCLDPFNKDELVDGFLSAVFS